jgi:hypothetical protein
LMYRKNKNPFQTHIWDPRSTSWQSLKSVEDGNMVVVPEC